MTPINDQHKTKDQLIEELEQIRSRTDELECKRADEALHNLIEIIHFAEHVSTKIHGLMDEAEIYRTVKEAFAQSKQYTASLLLLTDDDSSLRIAEASLSPEKVKEGEKATGLRMKGYKIDLKKSNIYSQVVREGKTVQVNVSDIISELFPRLLAYLISKTTGYEKKSSILTPLKRHGKIIGAFAMTSPELAEYFIPSVRNLAQHISNSLEWADEYAERKRAEEALRESEEKYRTIVENVSDQIIHMNKYGTIIYANDKEAIFGRKAEEIIGKNFTELGYFNVKDIPKYLKLFKDVITGKKTLDNLELEIKHKDGHIIPIEVSTTLIKKNGKAQGFMCLVRGITERKRAEEALQESERRYRQIIEEANDTVYTTDPNGYFLYVNPPIQKLTGYSRDELIGMHFAELVPQEWRNRVQQFYVQQFKDRVRDTTLEFPILTRTGEEKWIEQKVTLLTEDDHVTGFQSIVRDITERKRAEAELEATQEQLRNLSSHLQSVSEKERATIAREIHDESGQALTALQIDLYWLGERIPVGKEDLIRKINSMSDVVDTVIQSTQRISTELRPVLLDTLGLSAAIEWQVEEFQKRTGIQCEVAIDSADIDLDPDRSTAIFRILQESLTNVARHADSTEVWVGLNRHSDKLILEVVDNGKGITQDQISGSMAFGLIGMRERVRPWGGEFNISGIDGKGTTVTATISLDN